MRIFLTTLLCGFLAAATCRAEAPAEPPSLAPVVVTATRDETTGFDLPLSIDRIGRERLQRAGPAIQLSEPLAQVPGIVVQNRQNQAQDLQISSRGFGARSTFGVRGVRLYTDGIPATMPDGQGQTSHVDLGSASRIDVLRGPFSALYGNSSGGVISVFTENGKPGFMLSSFLQAGSDGLRHGGLKASGQQGMLNHVLSVSRFDTDGYREHSAATRDIANAKLRLITDADTSLTVIGNAVRLRDAQDPLGLTRDAFVANPRGVAPAALAFNTRKSVDQRQLGLHYEKLFGQSDTFSVTAYGGRRATLQYLAVPVAAQRAPSSAGGVVDLERHYAGIDMRWTRKQAVRAGTLEWTAGIAFDQVDEDRRGYENFIGTTQGVKGALRRDEANRAYNVDEYLQAQWEPTARWLLLAGVRHSSVHVRSRDHYLAPGNGDDSGAARFNATNPVAGATWRATQDLHVYVSYGQGFETPTLNELSYRPGDGGTASGFNSALRPATSEHVEAGIKARFGEHLRANLALFRIATDDELTVLFNNGGRAVYQNAGRTRRHGVELAVEGSWSNGVGMLLSYSQLRAVYADAFCNGPCAPDTVVRDGNRLPGTPDRTLYAEVSWRHAPSGFIAALEGKFVGKVYVDDRNSDAAPAYAVANLQAALERKNGPWTVRGFVRVDNLAGRAYAGSVIVNEGNGRFFEPAPGRTHAIGVSVAHAW